MNRFALLISGACLSAFAFGHAQAAATMPAGVVGCYTDGIHKPACRPIDYVSLKQLDKPMKPQCIVMDIKRNQSKCAAYTNGVAKKY